VEWNGRWNVENDFALAEFFSSADGDFDIEFVRRFKNISQFLIDIADSFKYKTTPLDEAAIVQ
jgi:hypothetical protein